MRTDTTQAEEDIFTPARMNTHYSYHMKYLHNNDSSKSISYLLYILKMEKIDFEFQWCY